MNKKIIAAAALSLVLCILLIRCKSPTETAETETSVIDSVDLESDTTVVAVDVEETVPDTVAAIPDTKTETADVVKKRKPLVVVIKNLTSATAPVIVSVYGTENEFPVAGKYLKTYKVKPKGKVLTLKITNLPYGTYAIATYQDVNENGKIDQNFIGVPKEPYAFSRNYKPVVKAPAFKDCKFDYSEKSNAVSISMIL